MDQDDRIDGNTNTNEAATPTEQQNTSNSTDTESVNIPVNFTSRARTDIKPDVKSELDSTQPAEINIAETIAISPEIEPSTVAFTPSSASTGASEPAQTPVGDQSEAKNETIQSDTAPAEAAPPAVSTKDKKKLILVIVAGLLLFAAIGVLAWWLLIGNTKDAPSANTADTLSSSTEKPKLGVAFTVLDSVVEYSTDGTQWQTANSETQLKEGSLVRTGAESRTVLTLDDGTAVRLDANTQVKLTELSVDSVKIEQINGSVYSRVVPSDRTYVIAIEDTTYTAMGTAFVTVKTETENGVQVYQSKVKVSGSDEEITEGKQYYVANSNAAFKRKMTDINIDSLLESKFVTWNLSEDENNTNFKEKLGILSQIKTRAAAIEAERQAAEKQAVSEKAEKENSTIAEKISRGTMTLGLVGNIFKWNYTGKDIQGYKVVYSKNTETPTVENNDSIVIGSIGQTSGEVLTKEKVGSGKYYVRVCAYIKDGETEKCIDYSNVVVINI